MVEATKRLNEKMEEITNKLLSSMTMHSIVSINNEDLLIMKLVCELVKEFEDVFAKQATIIESQNVKIDELLRIVKHMAENK